MHLINSSFNCILLNSVIESSSKKRSKTKTFWNKWKIFPTFVCSPSADRLVVISNDLFTFSWLVCDYDNETKRNERASTTAKLSMRASMTFLAARLNLMNGKLRAVSGSEAAGVSCGGKIKNCKLRKAAQFYLLSLRPISERNPIVHGGKYLMLTSKADDDFFLSRSWFPH